MAGIEQGVTRMNGSIEEMSVEGTSGSFSGLIKVLRYDTHSTTTPAGVRSNWFKLVCNITAFKKSYCNKTKGFISFMNPTNYR